MSVGAIFAMIDRQKGPVREETIGLIEAQGRVAARGLRAGRDAPPFDVSGLDGYAVKGPGTVFRVKGSLEPAGRTVRMKKGEALFVPTGARLPGAARFVRREHAGEEGQAVTVAGGPDERKVVRKGDWLGRGTPLVGRGDIVTPAAMGLLAMAGYEEIRVFEKPPVAIVTTGSELKKGLVRESNAFVLAGLVARDGGRLVGRACADDAEGDIADAVAGADKARLFILTGGTSKGKRDLTKEAVRRLGFRFLLDSPPLTPGKTMAFGVKGDKVFFILPGTPGAVQTLYDLFVRRALFRMAGRASPGTAYVLPLPAAVDKPRDKALIVPVRIDGRQARIAETYPREPNGYAVLEAGADRLPQGEKVTVYAL